MPKASEALVVALTVAVACGLAVLPHRLLAMAAPSRRSWLEAALLAAGLTGLGLVWLLFGAAPSWPPAAVKTTAVLMCCAAIAYVDARHMLIPNVYSASLLALGALPPRGHSLASAATGACLIGGLLWLVRTAWRRSKGEDGLGWGDVKLGFALGFLLGLERAPWVVFTASAGGALLGLVLRRLRRDGLGTAARLPLGTFLALAVAVFTVVWP